MFIEKQNLNSFNETKKENLELRNQLSDSKIKNIKYFLVNFNLIK